jgi:hypothetical protein
MASTMSYPESRMTSITSSAERLLLAARRARLLVCVLRSLRRVCAHLDMSTTNMNAGFVAADEEPDWSSEECPTPGSVLPVEPPGKRPWISLKPSPLLVQHVSDLLHQEGLGPSVAYGKLAALNLSEVAGQAQRFVEEGMTARGNAFAASTGTLGTLDSLVSCALSGWRRVVEQLESVTRRWLDAVPLTRARNRRNLVDIVWDQIAMSFSGLVISGLAALLYRELPPWDSTGRMQQFKSGLLYGGVSGLFIGGVAIAGTSVCLTFGSEHTESELLMLYRVWKDPERAAPYLTDLGEEEDGTGNNEDLIRCALAGPFGNDPFAVSAVQEDSPMSGAVLAQMILWLCDGPEALEDADMDCLDAKKCEGRRHIAAWENQPGGSGMSLGELFAAVIPPRTRERWVETAASAAAAPLARELPLIISESRSLLAREVLVERLGGGVWASATVARLSRGELSLAAVSCTLSWVLRVIPVVLRDLDSPLDRPGEGVLSGARHCLRDALAALELCDWVDTAE